MDPGIEIYLVLSPKGPNIILLQPMYRRWVMSRQPPLDSAGPRYVTSPSAVYVPVKFCAVAAVTQPIPQIPDLQDSNIGHIRVATDRSPLKVLLKTQLNFT